MSSRPSGARPNLPRGREVLLLLAGVLVAATASACVPHFRHLEHVSDVQHVLKKQDTREGLRKKLGDPGIVDIPGLYVYDWEKAKALAFGYFGAVAVMGHTGTRALFVFDEEGRIARSEIQGVGQGEKRDTDFAASDFPRAAAAPPPSKECADKKAVASWFVGPESHLVVQLSKGIRVCDASGSKVILERPGQFFGFTPSPDGRFAAAWDSEKALMLLDGSTLAPLYQLEPPSPTGMSLLRWGWTVSFSQDGRRVAAHLGNHGVAVYDTATAAALLRLPGRWSPHLSPDGTLLIAKAKAGSTLIEVDTGRDRVVRPLPKYPYGIAQDAFQARMLSVQLGAVDFSADGKRLAVASCAHAEVWDLATMLSSEGKQGLEEAFLLPFSKLFGVCAAPVRFSPDGSILLIANEAAVTVYYLAEHKIRDSYALPVPALFMSFTADLSTATFVAPAGTLLWEVGKVSPPPAEKAEEAVPAADF